MNLLLDRGASASDTVLPMDDEENTPNTVLTLAAQWAGPEMIKRLIACGADIHAKVDYYSGDLGFTSGPEYISDVTALFAACLFGNFHAARTLIDSRGVDVDLTDMTRSYDTCGLLPIHWASRNNLLQEFRDVPASAFQERAQNTINTIGLLLDYDPTTINIQDNEGNTPLHHAIYTLGLNQRFHASISKFLCQRGVDASIRNKRGYTPLHVIFLRTGTAEPVDPATVSILLKHGARPTDADNMGDTPLHLAAMRLESIDAANCLLEHGGDPSQRNSKHETSLHRAASGTCSSGGVDSSVEGRILAQDDMLRRLMKIGGEELMDLPNAEGKSSRQICQEQRHGWRRNEDRYSGQGRGRGAF
ncbi:hypothetical protein ACHAPI_004464 [Fusarium lateritium]